MPQGQLFYLMGASGVGKDSLLDYLRSHLPPGAPVHLARRFITRPLHAGGEAHIALSPESFRERLEQGTFSLYWHSHGNDYGIDREIDDYLARGWQVIINGSRHYLESARGRYPSLRPILVTVSHDRLFERLVRRGREGPDEIERRLRRAETLDAQMRRQVLTRLHNDGPLEAAGNRLLKMVLGEAVQTRQRSVTAKAATG